MTFYEKMYRTFQPLMKWLFRVESVGWENVPAGGAIIASNHTAFADPIVISAAAKRQVRYMAKKELFKIPLLSALIRALGAYPVDRKGGDVSSIKKTIAMAREGELVGIFPQGHRYGKKDPRTTPIKPGIGMIACRAKMPVVPVFIDCAAGKTTLFCKTTVRFGKPIPYEEYCPEEGKGDYMQVSRLLFDRVCAIKYGEPVVEVAQGETEQKEEKYVMRSDGTLQAEEDEA